MFSGTYIHLLYLLKNDRYYLAQTIHQVRLFVKIVNKEDKIVH